MSDHDLPPEEAGTADDFDDIPYPDEDEVKAPAAEDEEPIEETAEEAQEPATGTETAPPKAEDGDPDLDSLLESFPEEQRELVRKYGDTRYGKAQRSWQQKLDEAATIRKEADELRTKASVVDKFNERFEKDPDTVLAELQEMRRQSAKPVSPADPGPPPDLEMEPDKFKSWFTKREEFKDFQFEQKLAAITARNEEALRPILTERESAMQRAAVAHVQATLQAQDDEWGEIQAEVATLGKDPILAFKAVQELQRLRKGITKNTTEAMRGSESRPGLPRTGPRAKPKSTGDSMKDAIAELVAEGHEVPDEFK